MNDWQKLKKRKLEAPPTLSETTSNLQLPEVIGEKVDKRTLRKTGRTEQFATRVSKEWLEKVKGVARKENLKLVEVLEKALESYENQRQIPPTKNPFSHPHQNFTCDKCKERFQNETTYSYSTSLTNLTKTYCSRCIN